MCLARLTSKGLADSHRKGVAFLADAIVDAKVDRVLLGQPESEAGAAAGQHLIDGYITEFLANPSESAKTHNPESLGETDAQEFRQPQAVFRLSCPHPAVLELTGRVATHVVAGPVKAEVIKRHSITGSGATE